MVKTDYRVNDEVQDFTEALTSSWGAESELVKLHSGTMQVFTLGELTQSKKKQDSQGYQTLKGCQWARNCDNCPWLDCVINNMHDLFSYDSEKAKQIRSEYVNTERAKGTKVKVLAPILNTSEKTIRRQSKPKAVKKIRVKEMIQLYNEGIGVAEIAVQLGVHVKTVRRVLDQYQIVLHRRPLVE